MNKIGKYLKDNAQFVYSVILVVLIPVLIIVNALWQTKSYNDNMNQELQNKALLTESVLQSSLSEVVNNTPLLQNKISAIATANPDITEITVLTSNVNNFTVIASSKNQNIGLNLTSEDFIAAWLQDKPASQLFDNKTTNPPTRYWQVTSTLKDTSGQKVALLNMNLSLQDVDTTNKKNMDTSLIILSITIFLVLLMLINHFRLFEFTILFRKLEEVDKMKDDFISIATHEMKTPLAAIKGYISMMFEGLAGKFDQKTKVHLEKIYVNIQRLDSLLSETLDVSRLEQGRMQFDMQPYNIADVISQSITAAKDQAQVKGLKISEEKQPNLPLVFIDPERLRQVTDNLIGNAIKFTQKGSVTVSYKIVGGKLFTLVKDTGIGMNAHDRNNLFTKFYRIKNEKTVDIPGTGLGLWIAREIIHRMNGDIAVDTTENVGSTFTIQLPFIKDK